MSTTGREVSGSTGRLEREEEVRKADKYKRQTCTPIRRQAVYPNIPRTNAILPDPTKGIQLIRRLLDGRGTLHHEG